MYASTEINTVSASITFHTVAAIEAGYAPNPTIKTVKILADLTCVSLDDLIKLL